jgi:hypothetical protein
MVVVNPAHHQDILRGHEENNNQGEQGRLELPKPAKRRLPLARERSQSRQQQAEHDSVKKNGQRFELAPVQDE